MQKNNEIFERYKTTRLSRSEEHTYMENSSNETFTTICLPPDIWFDVVQNESLKLSDLASLRCVSIGLKQIVETCSHIVIPPDTRYIRELLRLFPNVSELNLANTNYAMSNEVPVDMFVSLTRLVSLDLTARSEVDYAPLPISLTSLNIIQCPLNGWCIAHLTRLKELHVSDMDIADEHISRLSSLTALIALKTPKITNNGLSNLTNLSVLRLTYNPNYMDFSSFKSIEELDLSDYCSYQSHPKMLDLAGLTSLKLLILNSTSSVDDSSLKRLTNVTLLSLVDNSVITDDGIRMLTALTDLNLTFNRNITDSVIKYLTNLTELSVCYSQISDEGISTLTLLKSLDIRCNYDVTDNGIRLLTSLTRLDMTATEYITDDSITSLRNLNTLLISERGDHSGSRDIHITDRGLQALSNHLTRLVMFCDGRLNITDSGLSCLTKLTILRLRNANISDNGISNLTSLVSLTVVGSPKITYKCRKLLLNLKLARC